MDLKLFERLVEKVNGLIARVKRLNEDNLSLSNALDEKEAIIASLRQELAIANKAKDETRDKVSALIEKIDGNFEQINSSQVD